VCCVVLLLCGAVPVLAQDSDQDSPIVIDQGLAVPADTTETIDTLFQEYDPEISVETRARAQAYVVDREEGITAAKAWNDHAVGRHLEGDSAVAVWAGLYAVRTEWRAEFVANCGTFLVEAGRFRVGLELLHRAYAMGYRTAYLHEAMAAAHEGLGDHDAAMNEIEKAAQLDPTDAAIRVQKSLLDTGKPPAPKQDRRKDDLEAAFVELEAHIKYVTLETRSLASALDGWEKEAGFPTDEDRAEWFGRHVLGKGEGHLSAVRQALGRARSEQPPFSDQSLEWRNAALLTMVVAYADMTNSLLASLDGLNSDWSFWSFWSSVAWRGKQQYIHNLRRDLKYNFRYEEPQGVPPKTDDSAGDIVSNSNSLEYLLLFFPRMVAYVEAISPDSDGPISCARQASELDALGATVQLKLLDAIPRFDNALAGVVAWNRLVVLDARRYANRWLAKLQKREDSSSVPEYLRNSEKIMIDGIRLSYSELMPHQPRFFVNRQVFVFENGRSYLLDLLESHRRHLVDCNDRRPRRLADFSKAELEKLLEELNELMKEDVEAKFEVKPECNAKIDGINASYDATGGVELGAGSLGIDERGDVSAEFGDVKVGTKGATGVVVEVGHSIGGGEGVVGKVSVKVTGEWDSATGEWDAVAEVGGKIGVGVAVPEVGELACYPGGGKVSLKARSFIRKEVMFQRVAAEIARR